jgi:hypothetical protein
MGAEETEAMTISLRGTSYSGSRAFPNLPGCRLASSAGRFHITWFYAQHGPSFVSTNTTCVRSACICWLDASPVAHGRLPSRGPFCPENLYQHSGYCLTQGLTDTHRATLARQTLQNIDG